MEYTRSYIQYGLDKKSTQLQISSKLSGDCEYRINKESLFEESTAIHF